MDPSSKYLIGQGPIRTALSSCYYGGYFRFNTYVLKHWLAVIPEIVCYIMLMIIGDSVIWGDFFERSELSKSLRVENDFLKSVFI